MTSWGLVDSAVLMHESLWRARTNWSTTLFANSEWRLELPEVREIARQQCNNEWPTIWLTHGAGRPSHVQCSRVRLPHDEVLPGQCVVQVHAPLAPCDYAVHEVGGALLRLHCTHCRCQGGPAWGQRHVIMVVYVWKQSPAAARLSVWPGFRTKSS